jgi:hypothetical protein
MPSAWTCTTYPDLHGSFLQSGLDTLSAIYGALQPRNRHGCPVCLAMGESGWMRPASGAEVERLAAEQGVIA